MKFGSEMKICREPTKERKLVFWEHLLGVSEDPLEKGMTTHSGILAWRIPWTEEPGRLQSTGSQKTNIYKLGVRHSTSRCFSNNP